MKLLFLNPEDLRMFEYGAAHFVPRVGDIVRLESSLDVMRRVIQVCLEYGTSSDPVCAYVWVEWYGLWGDDPKAVAGLDSCGPIERDGGEDG